MRVGVFSCTQYEEDLFCKHHHNYGFNLAYLRCAITPETVAVTEPYDAISVSVNDVLDKQVLDALLKNGIHHIALRSSGTRNIDIEYARTLNIDVSRVPNYCAASVAEHSIALMLCLSRKICQSNRRIKDLHFEADALPSSNLKSKTVGIIGTGAIGTAVVNILKGFGSDIICCDPKPSQGLLDSGIEYVSLSQLYERADIISMHCPLSSDTLHMIDHEAVQQMKENVMLINTCMADLILPQALIAGLKSKKIGYLGLDIFDIDELIERKLSANYRMPDMEYFHRLSSFDNVLITHHQGYFTEESMSKVVETTLLNLQYFFAGKICHESFL